MNETVTVAMIPFSAVVVTAGFIFGRLYFAALSRTVNLLAAGHGALAAWALTLGRAGGAAIALAIAARFGALALLSMLAGFLLARAVVLHERRRAT